MDELNPFSFSALPPKAPQTTSRPIDIKHRSKLGLQYELALEFRLDGYNYEIIVSELKKAGYNYSEHTVRDWFSANGTPCLKSIFEEIKEVRTKEAMAEYAKAREILSKDVPTAMAILHRGIHDKQVSRTQMESAKEILDRAGFGRQIKQDGNMQIESTGISKIADAMKKIAERAT